MKEYLNADSEKSNPANKIIGEKLENLSADTPVYLTHDIFFADDFLLYSNPENKSGSALIVGKDYDFALQDTIASEQSNRRCFRTIRFATSFTTLYADYHVYGDLVSAETINEVNEAAEYAVVTAEQTQADLSSHVDSKNVHGATPNAEANTLIIRSATGTAQVTEPKNANDIARLQEVETEKIERTTADTNLQNQKADKDLSNIESSDFYEKGIIAGLGQIIPEIQPTTEVYVSGVNPDGSIILSGTKPTETVTIPFTITTSGTLKRFRYVYPDDGIISALSRFKLILYMTSLQTTVDYEFSATVTARVNNIDYLVGGDIYVNRFSVTNPRIEIPLENNVLPSNLNRKAGDFFDVDIGFKKSTGSADSVNIISSPIFDSKLVRNGGDIASNNVIDFNGTDTKTQSQRNRIFEQKILDTFSDKYDLSEIETNKIWLNGKPIYRQGFFFNNLSDTNSSYIGNDVTFVTAFYGIAKDRINGTVLQLPHPLMSLSVNSANEVKVKVGKPRNNWDLYVFVEYVK